MAPSRPDMVFPGCPTCGTDVERTDLVDGVQAHPTAVSKHVNTDSLYGFRADAVPPGWTVAAGHGSPDHDVLTLHPCRHQLVGRAAHMFNLAALNLTHPDLTVELRVEIPSAVNWPDRREPRIVTKRGVYGVADLGTDDVARHAMAHHIRATAEAVIAMLHLEDDDPGVPPVNYLRAWGSDTPVALHRTDPAHLHTVDL